MKKNFLENNEFFQSLISIDDIKRRIDKVERKNDNLKLILVSLAAVSIIAACLLLIFGKKKYEFDLYDDEYFEDDFNDDFDDFEDEFEE